MVDAKDGDVRIEEREEENTSKLSREHGCIMGTGDIVESDTAACIYKVSLALHIELHVYYILQQTTRATPSKERKMPASIFAQISLFRVEIVAMDTHL